MMDLFGRMAATEESKAVATLRFATAVHGEIVGGRISDCLGGGSGEDGGAWRIWHNGHLN